MGKKRGGVGAAPPTPLTKKKLQGWKLEKTRLEWEGGGVFRVTPCLGWGGVGNSFKRGLRGAQPPHKKNMLG